MYSDQVSRSRSSQYLMPVRKVCSASASMRLVGQGGADVGPGPGGVFLQTVGQGDIERPLEPRPTLDQVAAQEQGGTDVVQRVRFDSAVTGGVGRVEGPFTPGERLCP